MTITVEVRKGNLRKAMRVLKKKVQKEGLSRHLNKNNTMKNLPKLNEKKKEGIKNFKKKMKKLELIRGY